MVESKVFSFSSGRYEGEIILDRESGFFNVKIGFVGRKRLGGEDY